jgi:glycyl-tRNA synthetase beta chain
VSSAELLIEIGVEELPAIPLLKIVKKIEAKWGEILKEYRLESDYKFDYTPRRLVIRSSSFPLSQADETVEMFGPPMQIAYKDGEPTGAALGFAKKCGISLEELTTATKGKSEVLYYKKEQKGVASKELLEEMLLKWLHSMEFGKMMRWGDLHEEFIRPIRWVVALLGDEVVDVELFRVKASNISHMHRFGAKSTQEVTFANYEEILANNSVVLEASKREQIVLEGIEKIESDSSLEVERDRALLAEVVAITEYPTPLLGSFDEKFLELPPEVIITSMKEHQRYFPVFKDGKLTNRFVVVSNASSPNGY